jgi:hypothetical protein
MPTSERVFTGTGTSGYITTYTDRHGNPMARAPGGRLIHPKTKFITNIFDDVDLDVITIRVVKNTTNGISVKEEDVEIGTKLKDLKLYKPGKRHYLVLDNIIKIVLTKEQVLIEDITIFVRN